MKKIAFIPFQLILVHEPSLVDELVSGPDYSVYGSGGHGEYERRDDGRIHAGDCAYHPDIHHGAAAVHRRVDGGECQAIKVIRWSAVG